MGPKIGEGNFSFVYACSDVWRNDLAAKVLKPLDSYEKVKSDAQNEFVKLMQFRNPYITFVYDAFEYRDTFYIITERCYFSVSDLFSLPEFNGPIWLDSLSRSLLQAVNYLHIHNYAHQDIHPGNIFITYAKDELVPDATKVIQFKLGDLGISKILSELGAYNTMAQWMLPPEILNESEFGPIDHRVDIYHIGLLFLQLAHSKELRFTNQEILDGVPREMALALSPPYNFALEKTLRRHVLYRTENVMELWRDLNTSIQFA